ncbi:MAG: methanogenesis marker 17 protein [Methanomicrobiaceae archaeon]|uniref:Methanogenesis marker 17 protein n=1 Tax=hydrocarbon metagenome TaxID=938273 RepID=A0A0W8FFA3_9ZZZZ|nr:methanogenesis marker 17 protein [Methanomicrobiaceae archaeon]MDD5419094.1 methanogenesis marker 17 protein [Methanomicrobiaceae archaeon]
MPPLEYFTVECSDGVGGEAYERIAADVLQDLDLLKVIDKLHIYIDPVVPIFVAAGLLRKIPGAVRLRDMAAIRTEGERTIMDISDETYLAPLLTKLWSQFARENVDQPDRFTVVLTLREPVPGDLGEMVVADPRETLYRDIIYAMQYIAPEGFKVRRQYVKGNVFYYVASEDTLPDDIVETLVAGKLALLGVTL